MANHTPEQLMRWEQEGSEYILTGSGSITITEYDSFGELVSDEKNSITTSRIVACVNACAGIPTEDLEKVNKPTDDKFHNGYRLKLECLGGC